ncbi:hypothetical protein BCY86_06090 [Pajaroellobacter abortibovis]|uniref:Uncharacterized protein n=2 Tax=Pajaroellobacter abortibovis TaxID=1882918 RepID=A0A1L6MY23_9BACT|nr:hypothetical protein BCY86_06090 [Pajaroellobacter abortibovis]
MKNALSLIMGMGLIAAEGYAGAQSLGALDQILSEKKPAAVDDVSLSAQELLKDSQHYVSAVEANQQKIIKLHSSAQQDVILQLCVDEHQKQHTILKNLVEEHSRQLSEAFSLQQSERCIHEFRTLKSFAANSQNIVDTAAACLGDDSKLTGGASELYTQVNLSTAGLMSVEPTELALTFIPPASASPSI